MVILSVNLSSELREFCPTENECCVKQCIESDISVHVERKKKKTKHFCQCRKKEKKIMEETEIEYSGNPNWAGDD